MGKMKTAVFSVNMLVTKILCLTNSSQASEPSHGPMCVLTYKIQFY